MQARELKTQYHTMLPLAVPAPHPPSGPVTLTQTVRSAAERARATLRPVARSFSNLAFQPSAMLAIMTYCYVRQIYRSSEIARALAQNVPLASICHQELPNTGTIRQFRNQNGHAIRACLTEALSFLARQKVEAGVVTKVNEAALAEEANRRLIMAMCSDSSDTSYGFQTLKA